MRHRRRDLRQHNCAAKDDQPQIHRAWAAGLCEGAGRDQHHAHCVLLYTKDDVERQFGMSARSRLTRREIHGVLRALRRMLAGEDVTQETSGMSAGEWREFEATLKG